MSHLPTVSIVTPSFNSASTIERCIDAVWAQRDQVLEHVVVDAGSTDGTVDILSKLAAERPDFLRIDVRRDRGISHGFNRGLDMARGEWIGIVNADDWYADSIIAELRPVMQQAGEAILHGRLRQHDPETGQSREVGKLAYDPAKHFEPLRKMPAQHPTCFVPRTVYDRVGGFSENFRIAMDYDFLQRAHLAGVPFTYVPKVITNFSLGGVSTQTPLAAAREMFASQVLHQKQVLVPLMRYLGKRLEIARKRLS